MDLKSEVSRKSWYENFSTTLRGMKKLIPITVEYGDRRKVSCTREHNKVRHTLG